MHYFLQVDDGLAGVLEGLSPLPHLLDNSTAQLLIDSEASLPVRPCVWFENSLKSTRLMLLHIIVPSRIKKGLTR